MDYIAKLFLLDCWTDLLRKRCVLHLTLALIPLPAIRLSYLLGIHKEGLSAKVEK